VEIFADDTVFGKLQVLETYEFFDGPRLFVAVNDVDSLFLILWIGSADKFEDYYVSPLSFQGFRQVRSGLQSLREAFEAIGNRQITRLRVSRFTGESEVASIRPGELDASVLPLPGERLTLSTPLPFIARSANKLRRNIVEIALTEQMSFTQAGAVLDSFQRLLRSLSAIMSSRNKKVFELSIISAAVGSFIVDAALPESNHPAIYKEQEEALNMVSKILTGESSNLVSTHPTIKTALKAFAASVSKVEGGIQISWIAPDGAMPQSVSFSQNEARVTAANMTKERELYRADPLEITPADRVLAITAMPKLSLMQLGPTYSVGMFKMVDLEQNRFALYEALTERIIRGSIAVAAQQAMQQIMLNTPYAVFLSLSSVNPTLVDIRPLLA
jgi:hypothetical protein